MTAATVRIDGKDQRLAARAFSGAAAAIHSTALLLRSASDAHLKGFANGPDQVCRNFMNHNSSAMLAIEPKVQNTSVFQMTLSFNDFYDHDPETGSPFGNAQRLGRIAGPILKATLPPLPMPLARLVAQ